MTDKPEINDKLPCEYMERIPLSSRYTCHLDNELCLRRLHRESCEKLKRYQV